MSCNVTLNISKLGQVLLIEHKHETQNIWIFKPKYCRAQS